MNIIYFSIGCIVSLVGIFIASEVILSFNFPQLINIFFRGEWNFLVNQWSVSISLLSIGVIILILYSTIHRDYNPLLTSISYFLTLLGMTYFFLSAIIGVICWVGSFYDIPFAATFRIWYLSIVIISIIMSYKINKLVYMV